LQPRDKAKLSNHIKKHLKT